MLKRILKRIHFASIRRKVRASWCYIHQTDPTCAARLLCNTKNWKTPKRQKWSCKVKIEKWNWRKMCSKNSLQASHFLAARSESRFPVRKPMAKLQSDQNRRQLNRALPLLRKLCIRRTKRCSFVVFRKLYWIRNCLLYFFHFSSSVSYFQFSFHSDVWSALRV